MLVLDNIKVCFDSAEVSANCSVPTGKTLALMGKSGSGKSTLLNVIAGFQKPDQGEVLFEGQGLNQLSPDQRPVTTLFQSHNLFSHLDVWRNVALGLKPNLRLDDSDQAEVNASLDWVGLSGFDKRLPHSLSGGEKQRVGLARCLIRKKPVLLLDEPFRGLDEAIHTEIRTLIQSVQANRGLTIVIATHDVSDAEIMAGDRIVRLK